MKLLFPGKEIDHIKRTALSIGMSLALVPITGLILYYTPWGIQTGIITLCLFAITILFASASVLRQHQKKSITYHISLKKQETNIKNQKKKTEYAK